MKERDTRTPAVHPGRAETQCLLFLDLPVDGAAGAGVESTSLASASLLRLLAFLCFFSFFLSFFASAASPSLPASCVTAGCSSTPPLLLLLEDRGLFFVTVVGGTAVAVAVDVWRPGAASPGGLEP